MLKVNNKNNKKFNIDKLLKGKAYPLIFLSLIVLVSVVLLMYVNSITKAKIAAEKETQIIEQLKLIFPEMKDYKYNKDEYYEVYSSEDLIGYAFTAIGKGYGGDINILIGINNNFLIESINIISNTETPGLGTKITENFFTDQFKGLALEDVNLTKNGGKVDAITGATISSKAVVDAVREELIKKIELIKNKSN